MKKKYLTIKEKIELAKGGKDVPICVASSFGKRDKYICKIRSIWNGSLKGKGIKL